MAQIGFLTEEEFDIDKIPEEFNIEKDKRRTNWERKKGWKINRN